MQQSVKNLLTILNNGCSASGNQPKKRSIDGYVSILRLISAPQCAIQRDRKQILKRA
jgi:hypothetical protein